MLEDSSECVRKLAKDMPPDKVFHAGWGGASNRDNISVEMLSPLSKVKFISFFFFSNAWQSCAKAITRVPHELSACLHKPLQHMQTTDKREIARHGHAQKSDNSQTKKEETHRQGLKINKRRNQPVENIETHPVRKKCEQIGQIPSPASHSHHCTTGTSVPATTPSLKSPSTSTNMHHKSHRQSSAKWQVKASRPSSPSVKHAPNSSP